MTGYQPYNQAYSFTAFQQAQGDDAFPGVQLDIELADIGASISSLGGFLQQAFRSDGQLTNGSVTRDALSSDIQIGLTPPTVWAPNVAYVAGNAVTYGLGLYAVQEPHTSSGSFQLDLAAGLLSQVANFATYGLLASNSVGAAQLQASCVTQANMAPNSVGSAALQAGSVTRDKAAANFGLLPIGVETDFAGIRAPAGWLLEFGQLVSRVTYTALFAVLTEATVATTQNGSAALTAVAEDLTSFGLIGSALEGAGVPQGALIGALTANSITMVTAAGAPAQATASVTGPLTIFPYGNGDGATTFAIPDARGRVSAGGDAMGGAAANRLTTQITGQLGGVGGEQTHVLSVAELAAHTHVVNDSGHLHGVTDPQHEHPTTIPEGEVVVSGNNVNATSVVAGPGTTGPASTGISIKAALTGISLANAGGSAAHNNVQPTRVTNKIIFAGV